MISNLNPATLEPLERVQESEIDSIGARLQQARTAQVGWASWPLARRRDALLAVQRKLIQDWERTADVISRETGKPRAEAVNTDILAALVAVDYAVRSMRKLFEPQKVRFENMDFMMRYMGRRSYVRNRPLGVIGIIAPWNYPLGIPFSQTIMALAAGNAVVFKPAPETPLTALEMQRLFDGSLPKNLVQTFVGGDEHGKALVASGADRIIFTGSSVVGSKIMALASQRLTPLTLELGGKDPCIVLEDADLERAAEGVAWGAFVNAGQTCVCVKRLYVHERIYGQFIELLKIKVESLRLGYGTDSIDADVGPLISEAALKRMEEAVEQAVRDGGKVLVGGRRAASLKGYYFEPTVIVGAPQASRVMQEEIFGPVVAVNTFSSDDEAIRLANDCPYALSGSVWTGDLKRGRRVAELMSGGTVLVNNVAYTYGLPMTPWGGKGLSGYGRTHGEVGFSELMEPHHIHVDDGRFKREVWWHPYRWENMAGGTGLLDALYGNSYRNRFRAALGLRQGLKGRQR
ncbi:MAG: aldehyde dehydrogenase family protein [Methanomassiliicoccus sp.]|nr:aldehyde dehydrogenase family protein [Methanomassiliicoccus sp.]